MTDPPIELNRCAGSAEGPPSERIWVVQAQPLRQENPMAAMSPLRRRMIEDMTVRNLSPTTQRSYVHAVAKFSAYFGKSPDRLDVEDVRAYQVHEGRGLGEPQPGGLRAALFLWGDARAARDARADCLRT